MSDSVPAVSAAADPRDTHHFLFLTGEMEQVGERVISADHKIEAGLYHIEQQKRNKGEGERDQPAAKEEVIQTQIVEEKIQRIA